MQEDKAKFGKMFAGGESGGGGGGDGEAKGKEEEGEGEAPAAAASEPATFEEAYKAHVAQRNADGGSASIRDVHETFEEARAKKSREAQERAKIRAKERAMAAVEKLKSEGDDFVGGVKGPPLVEKVDIRPTVQAFQSFHRPRPQPPKPTGEDVADR